MKDKMLLFIIGVLVGAVISTGAFYVYTTTNDSTNSSDCTCDDNQNRGGNQQGMPNGQNKMQSDSTQGETTQNEQPPEKPSDDSTQGQPPEKPNDTTIQKNESNN